MKYNAFYLLLPLLSLLLSSHSLCAQEFAANQLPVKGFCIAAPNGNGVQRFAMKGFRVVTCPWRNPEVGKIQVEDMVRFRKSATTVMQNRYQGILQTVWSGNESFLDQFYSNEPSKSGLSPAACFRQVFSKIEELRHQ